VRFRFLAERKPEEDSMTKTLLMRAILVGSLLAPNAIVARINIRVNSPFEGRYHGQWVAKTPTGEHKGEWTLSINSSGRITGKEEDYRTTRTADLNGSISDDGELRLLLEYPDATATMKGTVVKTRSGHLKGTVNQYSGKEVVATLELDLSPA
jgi:hypothetical protein